MFGREHRYGPPQGWQQPTGPQSLGPSDWDAQVARGLTFEPYHGSTRLSGVRGDCLEPLIVAGRHMLMTRDVAADETLLDGGLYCIAWCNDSETQAYRERMGIASDEPITITKFLRFFGDEWWCQCKDSLARLDGIVTAQVVGIFHVGQPGVRAEQVAHAFQLSSDTGQLGANAATTAASGTLASSITLGIVRNLASASIVVPAGQTWNVAVNGVANISLGSSPSGACNLQNNGTTVQGPSGWASGDAGKTLSCPFSYIATLTGGTYAFTITGFNSSGGATHNYSTVTVTVLKR
jgi:hypothetical protein